tara:strand:- start:859 stop:1719 length:861 start_codon:yes stop_codon:yes gene_type:complete
MVDWFRRESKNIKTVDKRDTREGSWIKCPKCKNMIFKTVLKENFFVCNQCSFHFRITSTEYINILIDSDYKEIGKNILSSNPLNFTNPKNYSDQIINAKEKTGKDDAVITLVGEMNNVKIVLSVMDFSFIGGSMGSVVGEKIGMGIDYARNHKLPFIIITASGGARMQEGVLSLMQLAKISTKLAQFSKKGGLFIPILTDPTTGGISASIAMQGDVILAEPNALIGFAGPRVIKQTIGEDLPEGFQKSEFLLSKGFLDNIVNRKELKSKLTLLIKLFTRQRLENEK